MKLLHPALAGLLLAGALVVPAPATAAPVAPAGPPGPEPVPAQITTLPLDGTASASTATAADSAASLASDVLEVPEFDLVAVTWPADSPVPAADLTVEVRVREEGRWTGWTRLGVPDLVPDDEVIERHDVREGTDPLFTDGADAVQVRVRSASGELPEDLQVATINPGDSPADAHLRASVPAYRATDLGTDAAPPAIITRAEWGADESKRTELLGRINTVKSMVIHHTAGSNDYTAEQAAAQVRGIYAYHGQTLGWGDIGYHFLVDKFGRVYEGRYGSIDDTPKGAHAGGNNTDTMGISAMGNYDLVAPPQVMVDAMARVTGWKLAQFGVDPADTVTQLVGGTSGSKYPTRTLVTLPVVNGHLDTYHTACPGRYLYPKMAEIRTRARAAARTYDAGPVNRSALFATHGDTVLTPGSRGYAVRDLEKELTRRGYDVGHVDITWEEKTTQALRAFQGEAMLPLDDRVDSDDWRALSGLGYPKVVPPTGEALFEAHGWDYVAPGYVGEAVRSLQHNLNLAGYPAGRADGHWSPELTAALRDWQSDVQVTVDVAMHTNDWRALAGLPYPRVKAAQRLAGPDRYATAARASREAYEPGVPVVYVASGADYPDALSGAALAGRDGGPVLLVRPTGIPPSVVAELQRLQPQRIVVLGGPVAVSPAVEQQLRDLATADTPDEVNRLAGANRYGTSAEVAKRFPQGLPVVYVATGAAFADALAGAALAGHEGAPVLLTGPTVLHQAVAQELARLRPQRIVVLGGPTAVDDAVLAELASYATADTPDEVTRVAGANRYETAARIAGRYPTGGTAYVVSGADFPDALAAAAIAGREGVPVLLSQQGALPPATEAELTRIGPSEAYLLGGRVSLSTDVAIAVSGLLR
jgi:putative cell wall-binding protein